MFTQIIDIKIVSRTINSRMINDHFRRKNNALILSMIIKKTCLKKFIKTIKMIMITITRRRKKNLKKFFTNTSTKNNRQTKYSLSTKKFDHFSSQFRNTFSIVVAVTKNFFSTTNFIIIFDVAKKIINFNSNKNKSKVFCNLTTTAFSIRHVIRFTTFSNFAFDFEFRSWRYAKMKININSITSKILNDICINNDVEFSMTNRSFL